MNKKKIIILRHDFDHADGIEDGVSRMFDIERKYNVKSTTFLRYDRGVCNDSNAKFYIEMESQGWEFGLHLANHEAQLQLPHPLKELQKVRTMGVKIHGVAACGGNYRWLDPNGWKVQDSLGLDYICPSALAKPEGYVMKTCLAPGHITLDGTYIKQYGSGCLTECVKEFTYLILRQGVLALLSHNTWFYQETACATGERLLNGKYYDSFINHFASMPDEYEFMTYAKYLQL